MTGATNTKSTTCKLCNGPAKYTCPGCECRTCSLHCSKEHKQQTMCTGQRNKVKYKPMSQINDLDILNDYRLLEGLGRQLETVARSAPRRGRDGDAPPLRPFQYRLRRAARRRRVRLDFLPEGFERRRNNSTRWHQESGCMLWRVEWRLPLADAVCTDDRLEDTTRLSEALHRHLPGDLGQHHPLLFYRAALESGHLRLFLQAERVQQGNRYIELPLKKTLQECLKDRLVIEFPVLVVTTEEHAHRYRDDVITESFFSLCRQEEQEQRRARRAERRRPSVAVEVDEPGRKVPRPHLDGVAVVTAGGRPPAPPSVSQSAPPSGPPSVSQPGPPSVSQPGPPSVSQSAPAPVTAADVVPAAEEPATHSAPAAAAFGLFGAEEANLSS